MFHNYISKIISKIKGENFSLDSRIPIKYFMGVIIKRIVMMVRGLFIFNKGFVFIGNRTKIKCKNKITFMAPLSIGEYCNINALSTEGIQFGKTQVLDAILLLSVLEVYLK